MRVLLSAYACEPGGGSEPEVGWQWARQAARHHSVWVLTRANNRRAIEAEVALRPDANLQFVYYDLPRWARVWKRGAWGIHAYYYLWQLLAARTAREFHARVGFDVAHHVTFVSARFPAAASRLGVPFVWGPLAGGDGSPPAFYPSLGLRGALGQFVREISTRLLRLDPLVLATAGRASVALIATPASRSLLPRSLRARARLMPAIAIDRATVPRAPLQPRERGAPLRVLFAGNLVAWKGVHLALRAIAEAARRGADVAFTVVGDGPERGRLERLALRLGIADRVRFLGRLDHASTLARYGKHDAFLFPSLQDSGGMVVLEAMAAGLPVVCLDAAGPSISVADGCGIRVPVLNPNQVVGDLASALVRLAEDDRYRLELGLAAQQHIEEHRGWDRIGEALRDLYPEVVARVDAAHVPPRADAVVLETSARDRIEAS